MSKGKEMARKLMPRRQDLKGTQGFRGFTLIELMVTISIMAILLMIAVPSFQNATLGSKLSSFANSLVSSAHLARSEAIKRNATVALCASSDGASCATSGGWEQGWIVRAVDGTVIQRQQALPVGFNVTATGGAFSVNFQPSGVNSDSVSYTVCRSSPEGSQERVVAISTTGRPTVTKTTTGSCS
jgi:type IV fimbrial biogenesis protein FimT